MEFSNKQSFIQITIVFICLEVNCYDISTNKSIDQVVIEFDSRRRILAVEPSKSLVPAKVKLDKAKSVKCPAGYRNRPFQGIFGSDNTCFKICDECLNKPKDGSICTACQKDPITGLDTYCHEMSGLGKKVGICEAVPKTLRQEGCKVYKEIINSDPLVYIKEITCVDCDPEQYHKFNGFCFRKCEACTKNILVYNASKTCTICQLGTYCKMIKLPKENDTEVSIKNDVKGYCVKHPNEKNCRIWSFSGQVNSYKMPICLECNEGYLLNNNGECNMICSSCLNNQPCSLCKNGDYCQLINNTFESAGICYKIPTENTIKFCNVYIASIDGSIKCGVCDTHYYPDSNGICTDFCDCTIGEVCKACGINSVCKITGRGRCIDPIKEIKHCKYLKTRSENLFFNKCGQCYPGYILTHEGSCSNKCFGKYYRAGSKERNCGEHHYCQLKISKTNRKFKKIYGRDFSGHCMPAKHKRGELVVVDKSDFYKPDKKKHLVSSGKKETIKVNGITNCARYRDTDSGNTICYLCKDGFIKRYGRCTSKCSFKAQGGFNRQCGVNHYCKKDGRNAFCRKIDNNDIVNGCYSYSSIDGIKVKCLYCMGGLHQNSALNICSNDCSECKIGESCSCGARHQCVYNPQNLNYKCTKLKENKNVRFCKKYITTTNKTDGNCTVCGQKTMQFIKKNKENVKYSKCEYYLDKRNFGKKCSKNYYVGTKYRYRTVSSIVNNQKIKTRVVKKAYYRCLVLKASLRNCTDIKATQISGKRDSLKCGSCREGYKLIKNRCKKICNSDTSCYKKSVTNMFTKRISFKQTIEVISDKCLKEIGCRNAKVCARKNKEQSLCENPRKRNSIVGCTYYKPLKTESSESFSKRKLQCQMCRNEWTRTKNLSCKLKFTTEIKSVDQ